MMKFRKDINGVRAFAVLAVVLFHFKVSAFSGGFVGVDIFFVISGYLMTGIIFGRLRDQRFSLLDFYLHRARRIIPALAVLCVVMIAFGYLYLLTPDYKDLMRIIRKVMLFTSNYQFYSSSGYFDSPSQENWLLHTWSLSVEWQFYLIYPLIILLLSKCFSESTLKALVIIVLLSSLTISIVYTPIDRSAAFYLLPTRAWEMLAGGILFLFPAQLNENIKKILEYSGFAIILIAILTIQETMLWPSYLATIPVMGTMFILIANRDSFITGNIFCQWLGKISYSVYLWHWPIAVFLLICGLVHKPIFMISGILLSLFLGYLSYFLVEKRFTLKANKFLELIKYILIVAFVIALAALMISLIKHHANIRQNSLFSETFQKINYAVEHKTNEVTKHCLISHDMPIFPECKIGEQAPSAIIMGDSHAGVIFPAIQKANTTGSTILWAYIACPMIEGAKFSDGRKDGCSHLIEDKFKLLATAYPNVPVVFSNFLTYFFLTTKPNLYFTHPAKDRNDFYQQYKVAYLQTMCKVAKTRPVYIVKPIPRPAINVAKKMATHLMVSSQASSINIPLEKYKQENHYILEVMEEAKELCGVQLLDPTPYFCQDEICKATEGNMPLYFDDNHLTEYGSMRLIPLFKQIFNKQVISTSPVPTNL